MYVCMYVLISMSFSFTTITLSVIIAQKDQNGYANLLREHFPNKEIPNMPFRLIVNVFANVSYNANGN